MRSAGSSSSLVDLLVRSWWMLALRGVLALAMGCALVAWSAGMPERVILVFGVYAALDGLWALGSVARLWRAGPTTWPVALEGVVSIMLAGAALTWPLVPRDTIYLIGAWGLVTGILEIKWAHRLPTGRAFRWLLVTAGVCSLFLASVVLALPHTDEEAVRWALSVFSVAFGVTIATAAWHSRRGLPGTPASQLAPPPRGAGPLTHPRASHGSGR